MRWLLATILCLVTTTADAVETRLLSFIHDGIERQALIDAPANARHAPVLVGLHGGLAGPMTVRRKARVTLARHGWVVVWPSAIGDWNDGRVDGNGEAYDNADDIGFLRRLIQTLADAGTVDPARVFFAGPSIGGIMVLRLICDAPDLVAGAAIAIASLPEGAECADGPPVPTLFIHGTDDSLMPPGGGRIGGWNPLVRDRGWVRPVADTVDLIADRNGCSGYDEYAVADRAPDDGSTVLRREYRGCSAPFVHYVVDGGGHTWPGATPSRLGERIVGATNQDFSATEAIEAFFGELARTHVQHTKRAQEPL